MKLMEISNEITKTICSVSDSLQDEVSRQIFSSRILYSLTNDVSYMQLVFNTTPIGRRFKKVLNENKEKRKILFGAGRWGGWVQEFFPNENWVCFADSFPKQKSKQGLPVISYQELCSGEYRDAFIIVATRLYYNEIVEQLLKGGFDKKQIYALGKQLNLFNRRIYFDLPQLYHEEAEVFVDAGAYDGETTKWFRKWSGGIYSHIYLFEPGEKNEGILKRRFSDKRCTIIPEGLWCREAYLSFLENGSESRFIESSQKHGKAQTIPVTSLDDAIKGEKVTFIKMDIEGAEYNALQGAEKIIKANRPKLAVSVYHKPEDIWTIPGLLQSMHRDYKFYLRHYSLSWFDTVLYAL